MTLEEAIKNFEQEIGEFEGLKKIHAVTHEDYERIEKTRQLAEWLRKYQKIKEIYVNWNVDFGFEAHRAMNKIGKVLNGNDD